MKTPNYLLILLFILSNCSDSFAQNTQKGLDKKFEDRIKKLNKYAGKALDFSRDLQSTYKECLANGYSTDYCQKTATICATYNFVTQNIPGLPADIMRELQLFEVYKPYCGNGTCFQCCFQNGGCNTSFHGFPVINCNKGYGPDSKIAGITRVVDPNPQVGQTCLFTPQTCDHLALCNLRFTPQQIAAINNDPNHMMKQILSKQQRAYTFANNALEYGITYLINNFSQGKPLKNPNGDLIDSEPTVDDLSDMIYGRGHKYWYALIDTINRNKGDMLGFRIKDSITNRLIESATKLNINRQFYLAKYLSSIPNLYNRLSFTESKIWTQSDKIAYLGDTTKIDSIFLTYLHPFALGVLKDDLNGLQDYRLLAIPLPGETINSRLYNGDTLGTPPIINVTYNTNSEFQVSVTNSGTHISSKPMILSFIWGDGTTTETEINVNQSKIQIGRAHV